ncbi:MAG: arylesterase [Gammaproteobacteria bacterium]
MRLLRLLLLISLLWLTACGGGDPRLTPLDDDAVVLAFGDSLTHGTGASADQSYPAVLQELIGHTVIRSGVPGEVSAKGLERLDSVLDEHQPALVLLCHGGNDLLQRKDKGRMRANLQAMIERIRERGAEVVLIGVAAPIPFFSAAEHYERVAEETGVAFQGSIIGDVLGDADLRSDQVHPNAQGYRRMAEAVAELLREHGALR